MKFYKLFFNPTKKLILCFQRSFFLLRSFRASAIYIRKHKKMPTRTALAGLENAEWNKHFRGEMSEIQSSSLDSPFKSIFSFDFQLPKTILNFFVSRSD